MSDPFDDAEARSLIEDFHDDSCPAWCKCQDIQDEGPETYDVKGNR